MTRILKIALVCLLLFTSTVRAVAPANAIINNQATAEYTDPVTGQHYVSHSNIVQIHIRAVNESVLEQSHEQHTASGKTVLLPHTLSNYGSLPADYFLSVELIQGSVESFKLIHDRNGNGVIDEGDTEIDVVNGLPAGDSLSLIIVVTIPAQIADGTELKVKLIASEQLDGGEEKLLTKIDSIIIDNDLDDDLDEGETSFDGVSGIVFNSSTQAPISGVGVQLFDQNDEPIGEEKFTNVEGYYQFPTLPAGEYYLSVSTQGVAYAFPSTVTSSELSEHGVSSSSYGFYGDTSEAGTGLFSLSDGVLAPVINIPLDPFALEQRLIINKRVSQSKAMVGDMLTYTITLKNETGIILPTATIEDTLPLGFKLLAGSVKLDSEDFSDVYISAKNVIQFKLQDMLDNETYTLSYVLQVTATAERGDGVNTAVLIADMPSGEQVRSSASHAKVEIKNTGVLSDEGIIFGKVFLKRECTRKSKCTVDDKGEPAEILPIGGVQVYLSDGNYVITDAAGDYNFHGLTPDLHVVKLDTLTLPPETSLAVTSTRQTGDASSFFVDLTPGDFQRVDFVVNCPINDADATFSRVRELNAMLDDTDGVTESGSQKTAHFVGPLLPEQMSLAQAKEEKMPITKEVIKKVNYKQAKKGTWLWPKKHISLDGRFMVVIPSSIKSPALFVNGEEVSIEQLGEQIANKKTRSQVLSWYGVKLKKGENKLEVRGINEAKKLKVVARNTVIAPSRGVSLKLSVDKTELIADSGKSNLPIKITALDELGNQAKGTYFVTLEATKGTWLEKDIQETTAGHQIKISNGEGIAHLRSSGETGKVHIRAMSDEMEADTDISQVIYMRPLIASGFLSVTAHSGGLDNNGMFDDGTVDGRGKVFIKGKIKEGLHLTLAFDSNKSTNQAANFQNELNESYYPARGDASLRNREAKSQDKLFVKVEKGRSSIMWGDYELDKDSRYDLAKDQRTLTGAQAHFENEKTQMEVFAAPQENNHFIEEFPGNGTSMQYRLAKSNIVINSEVIELITYGKDNTGLVISSQTLVRSTDYTLDSMSGYLSFHRVIPQFNENLDPVYIRVNYDFENEGESDDSYLVAGARIKHKINDELTVGASFTQDQHEEAGGKLVGAYIDYQPSKDVQITWSSAQMSHNNGDDGGKAHRLSARKKWENGSHTDLMLAQADEGFTNSGAGIAADHREAKLIHYQELKNDVSVKLEGIHNETMSTDTVNQSLSVIAGKHVGKWKLEAGGRYIVNKRSGDETRTANTAIIGANRNIRLLGQHGRVGGQYEQDIADSSRNHLTANAEISVGKKSSVYARYDEGTDFLGSTGLDFDQRRSVLTAGVKTKVKQNTELYSEYRSNGYLGSSDAENATGVRGSYTVEEGLRVAPTLEIVRAMEGDTLEDSVAATLAVTDIRDKSRKKYLRVEGRHGEARDFVGIQGDYTARLSDDWTGVIRDNLRVERTEEGTTGNNTFTVGAARRPMGEGKLNSQYMYQWKKSRGLLTDSDESTHLLSTHQNYQVNDKLGLSGRLGGKYQVTTVDSQESGIDTFLFDAKSSYELSDRFDFNFHGGVLGSNGFDETSYSAGAGVNFFLTDNWRLGVGYNFKGFEDKDLDSDKQNADGFFVKLQLKVHENLFGSMVKRESRLLTDSRAPNY